MPSELGRTIHGIGAGLRLCRFLATSVPLLAAPAPPPCFTPNKSHFPSTLSLHKYIFLYYEAKNPVSNSGRRYNKRAAKWWSWAPSFKSGATVRITGDTSDARIQVLLKMEIRPTVDFETQSESIEWRSAPWWLAVVFFFTSSANLIWKTN